MPIKSKTNLAVRQTEKITYDHNGKLIRIIKPTLRNDDPNFVRPSQKVVRGKEVKK